MIPRGGAGLIEAVVSNATVPTIETGVGNCHVYVHALADLDVAVRVILNSKTRRPSVCNTAETVLIDKAVAADALPPRITQVLQSQGVVIHGDEPGMEPATEDDWTREYLSMDIAMKVVDGLEAAVSHIDTYGTGHTEAIITTDLAAADEFTRRVDAAAVMVNASTAFTDGEQFGFGAEIGISTQKLHARGPMGLPELTSTKWLVWGQRPRSAGVMTSPPTEYTGSGPQVVPSFTSVDDVVTRLRETGYLADDATATSTFLADRLGKPLLVEGGPAGVGKTELAKSIAAATDAEFVRLQCYEGIDEARALYEWNHAKQILHIQATGNRAWDEAKTDIFSDEFLLPRPLLKAISREGSTVLLIDEVDKADVDMEGLLLEVLSDFAITIPRWEPLPRSVVRSCCSPRTPRGNCPRRSSVAACTSTSTSPTPSGRRRSSRRGCRICRRR